MSSKPQSQTTTAAKQQKDPHTAGCLADSEWSGKKSDKPLQTRFADQVVSTASTLKHHVAGADQQGLDARLVFRLDLLKPPVELGQAHFSIKRVFEQSGITLRGNFMHGDPLGWVNGLVKRGRKRQDKPGCAGQFWHGRHPSTKRRTSGEAIYGAQQQPEPAPQPYVQTVAGCVALGIKPSFVQGAFVGSGCGRFHDFPNLAVEAAAPDFVAAKAPGSFFQGSRSFLESYGWLLALPIVSRECRRSRHDFRERPDQTFVEPTP